MKSRQVLPNHDYYQHFNHFMCVFGKCWARNYFITFLCFVTPNVVRDCTETSTWAQEPALNCMAGAPGGGEEEEGGACQISKGQNSLNDSRKWQVEIKIFSG